MSAEIPLRVSAKKAGKGPPALRIPMTVAHTLAIIVEPAWMVTIGTDASVPQVLQAQTAG